MKIRAIASVFCISVAATLLCSCAPPIPNAVQVNWDNHFDGQQFRYFKASSLGVWNEKNQLDTNATNIFENELYDNSFSYPTCPYFYLNDTLSKTYGPVLTAMLQKEIQKNDALTQDTKNLLSKTPAPFAYLTWIKITSDETRRYQDDQDECTPGFFGEDCNDMGAYHSVRQVYMQATIYNIAEKRVAWKANITASVDHVYYSNGGFVGRALIHLFDNQEPYPDYPSTDEALHYAFKSMAVKLYSDQSLPQTLTVPIKKLDEGQPAGHATQQGGKKNQG